MAGVLLIQAVYVGLLLGRIYQDRSVKYTCYIQRMDITEVNQIILLKQSGQKITLFDLKGNTHRY